MEQRSGPSGFVVDIVVFLQVSLSIVHLLLSLSPYQRCLLIFIHTRLAPRGYRKFQVCKWKTSLFLLSKSPNLAVEWTELNFKITKLLLCWITHYAMRMYGIVRVLLHLFFRHYMDASSYHHPPGAFFHMKEFFTFWQTAGWSYSWNGRCQ